MSGPFKPTTDFQPTVTTPLKPLLEEDTATVILGRSRSDHIRSGHQGLMDLGVVSERPPMDPESAYQSLQGYKVMVDAEFPHVIFICGKRGSGKSYTLGVFAEELTRIQRGVGTVIIDPIGIFWSMKEPNRAQGEKSILRKMGLEAEGFDDVQVMTPVGIYNERDQTVDGPFSIATADLSAEDWCVMFDINRFKAQGLLIGEVLDKVRNGYQANYEDRVVDIPPMKGSFSIGDIIKCMEFDLGLTSREEGYAPSTRRSVVARFKAAAGWGLFTPEGTPLSQISRPNGVTVIDVSDPKIGDARRALIVGILARKILEARMRSSRSVDSLAMSKGGAGDEDIPVTWLVVDEAHLLLPHTGHTAATEPLVEFAKLGRKPGCGLVLATQRPAATNDDILSQVDFLIGHNLALEDDMAAFRRRVPSKVPKQLANSDFIRGIPVGSGLVADQKTQMRAMVVQIRPRLSHHAGRAASATGKKKKGAMGDGEEANDAQKRYRQEILSPSFDLESLLPEEEEHEVPVEEGEFAQAAPQDTMEEDRQDTLDDLDVGPWKDHPVAEWGSNVLIKSRDLDLGLSYFNRLRQQGTAEEGIPVLSISRSHPQKIRTKAKLPPETEMYWLSKTGDDRCLSPTNLEKLSHTISQFIAANPHSIILLEGLEYLISNNNFSKIMRFVESVHEKVVTNETVLLVPFNPGTLEGPDLHLLEEEVDLLLDTPEDQSDQDDDADAAEPTCGELPLNLEALTKKELMDLCRERNVTVSGNKGDLIERLVECAEREAEREEQMDLDDAAGSEDDEDTGIPGEQGDDDGPEAAGTVDGPDPGDEEREKVSDTGPKTAEIVNEALRALEEEKEKMEVELAHRENALLAQMEEEEKRREAQERALEAEREKIAAEKKRLEEEKKRRIEEERKRKIKAEQDRIKEMERRVQQEAKRITAEKKALEKAQVDSQKRLERERSEMERQMDKRRKELERSTPPPPPPRGPPAPRVDALRPTGPMEGREFIVAPQIIKLDIMKLARKNINKGLFRKKEESVELVQQMFVPINRFHVRVVEGRVFKKEEDHVVLWDPVTGEMVMDIKGGLKETRGLSEIIHLDEEDLRIIWALRGVDNATAGELEGSTPLDKKNITNRLKKLVRRGLVHSGKDPESKQTVYALNLVMDLPRRPERGTRNLPVLEQYELSEDIVQDRFAQEDITKLVTLLTGGRIVGSDTLYYPVFRADVGSPKGSFSLYFDAVSGKRMKAHEMVMGAGGFPKR